MNLNELKQSGFEVIAEIDNYYPNMVKSGKYTFKTIYYNEKTHEIKAVMTKTMKSKVLDVQEIPLEEIRLLDSKNPLKIALSLLEDNIHNNLNESSNKIFDAIKNGDVENLKKILSNGYDLNNIFDEDEANEGKTPLMAAVEENNINVVKVLLDFGSDIFQRTEQRGDNALTWCSKWGTADMFKFLANQMGDKFDINYQNDEGNTCLILAAFYGFDDMLKAIFEYEPDLTIKNEDGEDVFDTLNNSKINDRTSSKELVSEMLMKKTIKKIKP